MAVKRVCALARTDTDLNNEVFVWLRCILSLQMLVKLVRYCLTVCFLLCGVTGENSSSLEMLTSQTVDCF